MSLEYTLPMYKLNQESFCLNNCNGACCKDMTLFANRRDLELLTLNSQPVEVTNLDYWDYISTSKIGEIPDGVYYLKENPYQDIYWIRLIGKCPNLQSDNRCGIYNDRPLACRSFEVASRDCNQARRRYDLRPLSSTQNQGGNKFIHALKRIFR